MNQALTTLPRNMVLPADRVQVRPTTLAPKFLIVKYSSRMTPVRMVFSSGIPEPVDEEKQG